MKHDQHPSDHALKPNAAQAPGGSHYRLLLLMIAASFVAMFVLMYAMVDRLENALPNLNQAYMAGLMSAPMLVIELVLMRSMYPNRRLNLALLALGVAIGVVCWVLIRQQAAIGDREFLRSMIPHHASAILMCQEASIQSSEIKRLCSGIVDSQSGEIAQMKRMLEEQP